jgi:hypothetical protein
MVKPDVDTLVTAPDDPPAAGPDRALDPPPPAAPPGPCGPSVVEGAVAVAAGDVAAAEGVEAADEDAPQAAESPITPHITAAAAIRLVFLPGRKRRPDGSVGSGVELVNSSCFTMGLL